MKNDMNKNMDRTKTRLLGALMSAALLVALPSCSKKDNIDAPGVYFEYTACFHRVSEEEVWVTRGAYTESEMKITDVNLYVYDSRGDLYRQIYTDAIYTVKVRLALDSTYTILALANVGEVSPERRLEDMKAKTLLPWDGAEAMNGKGEPMTAGLQFTATHSAGLYIDLVRLVARYDVILDQTDMIGKFTVRSLKLCQANDTLVPFVEDSPRSAATSVIAVADSATADDLAKLNAGGRRSFHISENRQGVLLPDNTDPWAKVPDSVPEKSDVCTYLEMRGDYHDDGITISDMGFRLYLGNDATTDFDIARNTTYTVTVGIADKATAKLSWKVVPGTTNDSRTLSWSPNPDTLCCEHTLSVTPTMKHPNTTLDFSIEGIDGLGVTYTRSGNSLTFSSSKQLPTAKSFQVTASTADARHSAKLTVIVEPRHLKSLEADCSGYGGTGTWAWDFYKIGAGNTVNYTITAIYNDGFRRTLSESEYTVSDNTRSDLIDFSTNGIVRNVGSVDDGGSGTVKFSYSEDGRTATLTKTWWKLQVVKITMDTLWLNYNGKTSISNDYVTIKYNNGSKDYHIKSYADLNVGGATFGTNTGQVYFYGDDGRRLGEREYGWNIKCEGYDRMGLSSEGTFRGVKVKGDVCGWSKISMSHVGDVFTAVVTGGGSGVIRAGYGGTYPSFGETTTLAQIKAWADEHSHKSVIVWAESSQCNPSESATEHLSF